MYRSLITESTYFLYFDWLGSVGFLRWCQAFLLPSLSSSYPQLRLMSTRLTFLRPNIPLSFALFSYETTNKSSSSSQSLTFNLSMTARRRSSIHAVCLDLNCSASIPIAAIFSSSLLVNDAVPRSKSDKCVLLISSARANSVAVTPERFLHSTNVDSDFTSIISP